MLLSILIIALIFVILFSVIFSFNVFVLPFTKGVPYVPLRKKQLNYVVNVFNFNKDLKIVDLGCGDGRVLRKLEKKGFKKLIGYEINLWPYSLAKLKNIFFRSKSKIVLKNFEKINLSQFDIVFCYLLGSYLEQLKEKFEKELNPGSKVISYGFQVKGWKPSQIITTNKKNIKLGRIFIYQR